MKVSERHDHFVLNYIFSKMKLTLGTEYQSSPNVKTALFHLSSLGICNVHFNVGHFMIGQITELIGTCRENSVWNWLY